MFTLGEHHPFSYGICSKSWTPRKLLPLVASPFGGRRGRSTIFGVPEAGSMFWPFHAIIEAMEPINLQGASRDTHLHPRLTGPAKKWSGPAPWVSQPRRFTMDVQLHPCRWHLCCCCNIVQPLAINPIPNRLLLYTKKNVGFWEIICCSCFSCLF